MPPSFNPSPGYITDTSMPSASSTFTRSCAIEAGRVESLVVAAPTELDEVLARVAEPDEPAVRSPCGLRPGTRRIRFPRSSAGECPDHASRPGARGSRDPRVRTHAHRRRLRARFPCRQRARHSRPPSTETGSSRIHAGVQCDPGRVIHSSISRRVVGPFGRDAAGSTRSSRRCAAAVAGVGERIARERAPRRVGIEVEQLRGVEPEHLRLHRVGERRVAVPLLELGRDRERAERLDLRLRRSVPDRVGAPQHRGARRRACSSLPIVCAAVVGSRSTSRHTVPTSTHTLLFGGTLCSSSARRNVSMPSARVRVVRAFGVVLVPRAVEHDEVHVGEHAATPRPCRRAGCAPRRSRTSGRPLCATKIFTPRSCAFWITGRPIAGILEREALTVRAPRRVHLERGDLAGLRGDLHLVEPRVEIAEVGRDHVVHEHRGRAAVRELRRELLRAELVGERHRRVGRARVRARRRASRRSCRSRGTDRAGTRRGSRTRAGSRRRTSGTMPSTSCTVSGAFLVHGPSGITWCVCTSTTNSPLPPSACSHASTSCGGGTVNEPPGPARSSCERSTVELAAGARAAPTSCTRRGRWWRAPPRRRPRSAGSGADPCRSARGPPRRRARAPRARRRDRAAVGAIRHVLAVRARRARRAAAGIAVGIVAVATAWRHGFTIIPRRVQNLCATTAHTAVRPRRFPCFRSTSDVRISRSR